MNRAKIALLVASFLVAGAACGGPPAAPPPPPPKPTTPPAVGDAVVATAVLEGRSGSSMTGTARFVADGGSVTLTLNVAGRTSRRACGTPARHGRLQRARRDVGRAATGTRRNRDHGEWGHPPFHLGDIGNLHRRRGRHGHVAPDDRSLDDRDGRRRATSLGHAVIVHAEGRRLQDPAHRRCRRPYRLRRHPALDRVHAVDVGSANETRPGRAVGRERGLHERVCQPADGSRQGQEPGRARVPPGGPRGRRVARARARPPSRVPSAPRSSSGSSSPSA